MKKWLLLSAVVFIVVLAVVLAFALPGINKADPPAPSPDPAVSLDPNAVVALPTSDPVVFEVAPAAQPTPDVRAGFSGLIIAEGDVDAVMSDIDAWDGFSVLSVEYEGQTCYYIFPNESADAADLDPAKAIGTVAVNFDTNRVTAMNAQVDLSKRADEPEKLKRLYDFFEAEYPMQVVYGVSEADWSSLNTALDMGYDNACKMADSGFESRDIFGQFVFHVSENLVSFDFYTT